MAIGLYVHIPFCIRKCFYCDFLSYPLPEEEKVEQYVRLLVKEIELHARNLSAGQRRLKSVYLGGGTPSCLSAAQLVQILEGIRAFFDWPEGIECTLEANPGTLNREKLRLWRCEGVNRLSLGVQSFNAEHLLKMGRAHTVKDIEKSYFSARQNDYTNINIDLIYGLPGQTLADWEQTLEKSISLGPEHISTYGLKLEAGTLWEKLYRQGKLDLPAEETNAEMYKLARRILTGAGYEHYEISNFAQPGKRSRHNLNYWTNGEYIGAGLSASSYFNRRRITNTFSLEKYLETVREGKIPVEFEEKIDQDTEMAETMILGLRLLDGVSSETFEQRFKLKLEEVYREAIEKLQAWKLVELRENCLKLTEKALPVANTVFIEFI
ncbi:radical SAM family heme chaperone HemW [Calderihabitans maritimus]|uniref:Heme chaperone HemW n=1 Tax=Calderihabitans maritimus TaxID=1246530 RepID=A0A1Z5HVV9_9FIRM|nr:radical SAM family heme chaperone HemW [Calderihabitans maritimus]GAW93455.1 oxygen-independent coproporphyrinogen III oxidase [Calderihabitans maritimus]